MIINKKALKNLVNEQGYMLSKGSAEAMENVIAIVIRRAIAYTRPQKKIKPEDILRSVGGKG